MIKKILVSLDSSPFTDAAIRHAVDLAKSHHAELTGIAVIHKKKLESVGPVPIGGMHYAKNLWEYRMSETAKHADEVKQKFETACASEGVCCKADCLTGDPLDLMTSYARYHDLTVIGMRHLFDYGVIDEPENLICTLVKEGVRPIMACAENFRPIKRALIAYNGSVKSAAAMRAFVQLNLWPGIETRIVSFSKDRLSSKRLLDDVADYCKLHGLNPMLEYVEGGAKANLLSHAARWDADIIVMGNSELSPLMARFFNDAALHAIKHSDRALFLA